MIKAKKYNIADTNIANLGTEIEKKCKAAAAQKEPAWTNSGKKVGMEIWRIVNFHVQSVAASEHGRFFEGDSYIILVTYKKNANTDALAWNLHFWLGSKTSQDEMGTAAYKTVELDDFLGGAAVQFREVEGFESTQFLHYFEGKGGIRLLDGGAASGFQHHEPEKYVPRLLWVKGKHRVRVVEVPMSYKSLNSGDIFIYDGGLVIYQWMGRQATIKEKSRAAQISRALDDEREGKARITVLAEGDADCAGFWTAIGGQGPVAEAKSEDEDWEKDATRRIVRVIEQKDGKVTYKVESEGKLVKTILDTHDAFVVDVGSQVFAWIGLKAADKEKKFALKYAQDYIPQYNRPPHLPVTRILEGTENELFHLFFV